MSGWLGIDWENLPPITFPRKGLVFTRVPADGRGANHIGPDGRVYWQATREEPLVVPVCENCLDNDHDNCTQRGHQVQRCWCGCITSKLARVEADPSVGPGFAEQNTAPPREDDEMNLLCKNCLDNDHHDCVQRVAPTTVCRCTCIWATQARGTLDAISTAMARSIEPEATLLDINDSLRDEAIAASHIDYDDTAVNVPVPPGVLRALISRAKKYDERHVVNEIPEQVEEFGNVLGGVWEVGQRIVSLPLEWVKAATIRIGMLEEFDGAVYGTGPVPFGLTLSETGHVLNWRGENYVRQSDVVDTETPLLATKSAGTNARATNGDPMFLRAKAALDQVHTFESVEVDATSDITSVSSDYGTITHYNGPQTALSITIRGYTS